MSKLENHNERMQRAVESLEGLAMRRLPVAQKWNWTDDTSNCANENATVQDRLAPYTKDSQIFLQPVTERPYLPNYKSITKASEPVQKSIASFPVL